MLEDAWKHTDGLLIKLHKHMHEWCKNNPIDKSVACKGCLAFAGHTMITIIHSFIQTEVLRACDASGTGQGAGNRAVHKVKNVLPLWSLQSCELFLRFAYLFEIEREQRGRGGGRGALSTEPRRPCSQDTEAIPKPKPRLTWTGCPESC